AWLFLGAAPGGAATSTITVPATVTASTWTTATNTPAVADGVFYGVSCASATFCVGVGDQVVNAQTGTLIEQWNGSSWAKVTGAALTGTTFLEAVSCATATMGVAVGEAGDSTLVEQWNGSTWTVVPTPNDPAFIGNVFSGVSCPTTTFCMAAGQANGTGSQPPLAAGRDGAPRAPPTN